MANVGRLLMILGGLMVSSRLLQGHSLIPAKNSSRCGDWINYNDEKCYKIMDNSGPQAKEIADRRCKHLSGKVTGNHFPRLVTIKDKEQQRFLHRLFLDSKMAANVWLGLNQNNKTGRFEWNDGSKLVFSNFANPNMTESNSQCVEMDVNGTGLWRRVTCTNQNRIFCERDAAWPLADLEDFQKDSNQSGGEWNDVKSEKECKEKISETEQKTEFIKEAAEKAAEVMKDAGQVMRDAAEELIDATEKLDDREVKKEMPIKEISYRSVDQPTSLKNSTLCGNWVPYKDEKCIKVVDKIKRWEDAANECKKLNGESQSETSSRLLTIKSEEEQETLRSFLFVKNQIVDNVWLGLRKEKTDGLFQWDDGAELSFNNWSNQIMSEEEDQCAEIRPSDGLVAAGLWFKVNCKKKNMVVCEKRPNWTLETLQNSFLNFKMEQKMKEKELQKKMQLLEQTAVPIGFIYTQISGQAAPTILWPGTNWTDISAEYAGLFFRVVGGNASEFGEVQPGNTNNVEQVTYQDGSLGNTNPLTIPSDGSWSSYICAAGNSGSCRNTRYRVSTGEVRPRNQAMKLWQRNQ